MRNWEGTTTQAAPLQGTDVSRERYNKDRMADTQRYNPGEKTPTIRLHNMAQSDSTTLYRCDESMDETPLQARSVRSGERVAAEYESEDLMRKSQLELTYDQCSAGLEGMKAVPTGEREI